MEDARAALWHVDVEARRHDRAVRSSTVHRYGDRAVRRPRVPDPTISGPSIEFGKLLGPAAISPCTFTMDLDAIICSMIDRLARGPDQDVHVPSVGSQKYPSYNVDVIYL